MRGAMEVIRSHRRCLIIILTPILLSPIIPLYDQIGLTPRACNCLYMLLLMAVYWCTEVVHLAITALLPLSLAPLMGILEASAVSKNYFKDKVALFTGVMILATNIQHTGLHRRIALTFIKLFGTNPRLLMLGFMVPTWFMSMWISNSATTVMMVSILNCVIDQLACNDGLQIDLNEIELKEQNESQSTSSINTKERNGKAERQNATAMESDIEKKTISAATRFKATSKCLALSVCYAATCGGMATLTGTGTNLVCYDNIVELGYRLGYDFGITLPRWMAFAAPISIMLMLASWLWLQLLFIGCRKSLNDTADIRMKISEVINREYSSLGRINWQEGVTLAHFIALVALWLSRDPADVGGWTLLFPEGYVTDATAAMLVSTSLLFMPKYPPMIFRLSSSRPFEPLLSWQDMSRKLNWGVIFLIAGGFALADCVIKSGLADAIGNSMQFVSALPAWAMVLTVCSITAVVTEFTSNVVITSMLQPILANIAVYGNVHPLLLMIPSCIASSFAFALPVATPPNAIVYSSGVLRIRDMMTAGVFLNIVALLVILLAAMTWMPLVFDFNSFTYNMNDTAPITNMTTTAL